MQGKGSKRWGRGQRACIEINVSLYTEKTIVNCYSVADEGSKNISIKSKSFGQNSK